MDDTPKRDAPTEKRDVHYTGRLWRDDSSRPPQVKGFLMRDGELWIEFTGVRDLPGSRGGGYLLVGRVKSEPQPSLSGLGP